MHDVCVTRRASWALSLLRTLWTLWESWASGASGVFSILCGTCRKHGCAMSALNGRRNIEASIAIDALAHSSSHVATAFDALTVAHSEQ